MVTSVKETVAAGKLKVVEQVVKEAIDGGATPDEILDSMAVAMDEVGDKFQKNEIYVPEMLIAAKTMQRGVAVLKPLMASDAGAKYGTFVLGTVAGDLHDIGKNLVGIMVEAAGFEVVDLGIDVPAEKFVEAIKSHPDCKVVGVSALLTTTMESMRNTVKAIIDAGLKSQVKIMVGGAPITQAFADEIGADAYTTDAASAAAKARELASK